MLSLQEIERFNDDGYLILNNYASTELCDAVVNEIRSVIQKANLAIEHGLRLSDAWQSCPNIRRLATEERGLVALRQLFGGKPFPFQTLNFPVGTQQKLHSDTIHFDSDPSGYMAGIWVALEDVDDTNGPLIYCPGSHKLPYVTMKRIGARNMLDDYKHYENYIENMVQQKRLPRLKAKIKKGQAFVWHARLIHGGGYQENKARTRYSQVTHYFFEGMRYTTPMQKAERNPPRINMDLPYTELDTQFTVVSPFYLQKS